MRPVKMIKICVMTLTAVAFQSCASSTTVVTTPSLIPLPTASKWVTPTFTATPIPTLLPSPFPVPVEQEISVIFQPTDSLIEGITWQEYIGQFDVKDRSIRYSLSYPSEWFIYPEPAVGSVQIQNFPREEMLERGIMDMGGAPQVKIQVDFIPCEDGGCSQFPNGEPIVLSGLPGKAWVEYDQLFNLTTQTIILPIKSSGGALGVIIHVSIEPENVPIDLKMVIEHLLFSIKVG